MKGKSTRKGRRKSFLALCLAVAMAFCYNVPAFADTYEVNPDYETDDWENAERDTDNPEGISYDEDLVGKVVFGGDEFKLNKKSGAPVAFNPSNDKTWNTICNCQFLHDGEYDGYYRDNTIPIMIVDGEGKYKLRWPNDYPDADSYNDDYDKETTVKSWMITEINTRRESANEICFYFSLKPVETFELIYNIDEDYYSELTVVGQDIGLLSVDDVIEELEYELPTGYAVTGWYDNDEFNGICFCLFEFFTAVINCLSIHIVANVLKEFCFSLSYDLTALYSPIYPSCNISSFSEPAIKNLLAFALTISLYLFIALQNS